MSSDLYPDQYPDQDKMVLVSRHTEGGHEVDRQNSSGLFKLVTLLIVILVLSGIMVSQLFQAGADAMVSENAKRPALELQQHRQAKEAALTSYSHDDKAGTYSIPVERAKQLVLEQPSRLKAGPRPEGFIHPDDEKKK